MAEAATAPALKAAFEEHLAQTEGQVDRLEQVFELFNKEIEGKDCPAIDGIVEEGEEIISDFEGTLALDAGLIAAAQAVEHYEMSKYGTLARWAELLGQEDASALLEETLAEEEATDEKLTALADELNEQALANIP